eukprot:795026-Rhodomonas_salina.1
MESERVESREREREKGRGGGERGVVGGEQVIQERVAKGEVLPMEGDSWQSVSPEAKDFVRQATDFVRQVTPAAACVHTCAHGQAQATDCVRKVCALRAHARAHPCADADAHVPGLCPTGDTHTHTHTAPTPPRKTPFSLA